MLVISESTSLLSFILPGNYQVITLFLPGVSALIQNLLSSGPLRSIIISDTMTSNLLYQHIWNMMVKMASATMGTTPLLNQMTFSMH